jgi:hypothetical protein
VDGVCEDPLEHRMGERIMKKCAWLICVICIAGSGVAPDDAYAQSTGNIVGWGAQVVVEPSDLSDLVAVAGGGYHSLGLKSDGTIVAWGDNKYSQCNVPVPNADFVAVAGGFIHSLAIKSSPAEPPVLEISIDVKPGSESNSINCKGNSGVVPVAILTTEEFDALTVDHQTVVFGPDGAMEAHAKGPNRIPHNGEIAKRPMAGEVKRHEEDVDGDGDMDLLFHFRYSETGIQCGDTEVTLSGETYDGQTVTGTGEIRTVPTTDDPIPTKTAVSVSPNPFNPQTKVSFKLDQSQQVQVAVYDIRGRCVVTLAEGVRSAGMHSVVWQGKDQNGRSVPSGTYFFRVDTGGAVDIVKAVLLK